MDEKTAQHFHEVTKAITLVTQKMVSMEREILQLKAEVSHLKNLTRPYLVQKRRDTGEN